MDLISSRLLFSLRVSVCVYVCIFDRICMGKRIYKTYAMFPVVYIVIYTQLE